MTAQTTTRSCLILAPHPDDETLGCGATIMRKLSSGSSVQVVIATDGRHSNLSAKLSADTLVEIREEEARQAGAILGLPRDNIAFLRFEDGRLADHRPFLCERLSDILSAMNLEEIFVPSIIDTHPDHRILGELGRELAKAHRDRPLLYEYPIWFWDPRIWRIAQLLDLRPRMVRTEGFRTRKRNAVMAYRSQISNITGEAGWATLRPGFLRQFLQPEEIFFEVNLSR